MLRSVINFLDTCLADPPNIIVSNRIDGEGSTQLMDWLNLLGRGENFYSPKTAVIFRLKKTVLSLAKQNYRALMF